MSPPPQQPVTRVLRYAVAAGSLTAERLGEHEAYAARHGIALIDVLAPAERMHLLLIAKALGPTATLADAVAAIHRHAVRHP